MFLTHEEKRQNAILLKLSDSILAMEGITLAYRNSVASHIAGQPSLKDAFTSATTSQDKAILETLCNMRHNELLDPTRAFNNIGRKLVGLQHSLINSQENDLMIRIAGRIMSSAVLMRLVPNVALEHPAHYIKTMESFGIRETSHLINKSAEYIQHEREKLEQAAGNGVIAVPANLAL